MAHFKYIGIQDNGRICRGTITAPDKKSALNLLKALEIKHHFRIQKVLSEKTYTYTVRSGTDKPIAGETTAFEPSEVEIALRKLGYSIVSVRQKLWQFSLKPPYKDVVLFIRICADLLREKLPFDEILSLLSADLQNKTLKQTLKQIAADLKEGKEGKEVFGKHERVLGKFPAYMLGVASTSGDMAAVYESTARFIERDEEFKKNIRQALVMPGVIMLFMVAAVIFYVAYIFPKTAAMFVKFNIPVPPMTAATIKMSAFFQNNALVVLVIIGIFIVALVQVIRSRRGRSFIDKWIIRIPYIGPLFHKTSIEIFARVFNALYSESGDNISVIKIAAEACRNTYMKSQIVSVAIPLMLKEGRGLVESLEATGVFTRTALSRLRSGAEAGALKSSALQLANYYEKETVYRLKGFIDWVSVSVSVVIVLVVIALTIVSSETAVISPKMPGMRY